LPRLRIQDYVMRLAAGISRDYPAGEEINMVCVLEGARTFCGDLEKYLNRMGRFVSMHEIQVSSYGSGTVAGNPEIVKDLGDVEGKRLLLCDEIIDTGGTPDAIIRHLLGEKGAKEVRTCFLTTKPARRKKSVRMDYPAIEVPDRFLVGYGMDWDGKWRELPDIMIAVPDRS
jgi:hypoxanthine phosphoribosyltransferase